MDTQQAIREYKNANLAIQRDVMVASRRLLRTVEPNRARASWAERVPSLVKYVAARQDDVALVSAVSASQILAAQNTYIPSNGMLNTRMFSASVFGDKALRNVLHAPGVEYERAINAGATPFQAEKKARDSIDRLLRTITADTARGAMGTAVTVREGVGYVRLVSLPACPHCLILAGRFYRWNTGFQRHPRCDCKHVPTTAKDFAQAKSLGLGSDPYEVFNALSEAEQDALLGRGSAQAVRDGADIFQVVNSRRSRKGDFTLEGLGKHGHARRVSPGLVRYGRLTPEAIYARAESREQAVRWLKKAGYILDAGQVPTGAIRGQRIGFGQFGHGGAWSGGRNAEILRALQSGVRNPLELGTMTAAERRMFTATRDLDLVRQGIHPYSETALVMRGAPRIGAADIPLTPEVAAKFERHYYITMQARGEAMGMARLEKFLPGEALSAVDVAEVYSHRAARAIRLAEQAGTVHAARGVIAEAERIINDTPQPLTGSSGNGRKPPRKPRTAAGDDDFDEFLRGYGYTENVDLWLREVEPIEVKESALRVSWSGVRKGRRLFGGHSESSGFENKSYLVDWTYEEYAAAVRQVAAEPDFIRLFQDGRIEGYYGVVRGNMLRVAVVPESQTTSNHQNPEFGYDVRWRYPEGDETDHSILPKDFTWERMYRVVR